MGAILFSDLEIGFNQKLKRYCPLSVYLILFVLCSTSITDLLLLNREGALSIHSILEAKTLPPNIEI